MRYLLGRRAVASLLLLAVLGAVIAPAGAQQSETDVFVAQAILAYEDKRYDEALGYLREAVEQEPKNVEAWYYMGLVYIAQQRMPQAAEALERARSLAPNDFSVRFLLGVVYFSQDRKSTRLNSSHLVISYAVFCLKKKNLIQARPFSKIRLPHARQHLSPT